MRPALSALSLLCLIAAAPPGWFPGAGLLVLPGLAGLYALLTSWRRPLLSVYLFGLVHVLAFSWSLRHVVWWGYVAIGVVAAVYYLLMVPWFRGLRSLRLPGPVAFGLALAGTQWLRAVMPEIPYPHAQSAHCLYQWPGLLGAVAWGGEPLANFLLAGLGASAVDVYRAWHRAEPPIGRARRNGLVLALVAAATVVIPAPGGNFENKKPLPRVVAIQPNLPPYFNWRRRGLQTRVLRQLVVPTMEVVAGSVRRSEPPPDLVLWPETSYPYAVDARGDELSLVRIRELVLPPGVRLLVGTQAEFADGRQTPVAALIDHEGTLCGVYEKHALVPVGEFVPIVALLPAGLRDWVVTAIAEQMGAPNFRPGEDRPLLETGGEPGFTFGALLCYDNAFPEVVRDQVARGAEFLVVLSNEGWYFGGAELDQLLACAVCRALETRTPIVRCTLDGDTVLVRADGSMGDRLPRGRPDDPARPRGTLDDPPPGVLDVTLVPGPGVLRPLAWLQTLVRWIVGLSGLAVAWHLLGFRARLGKRRPVSGS